MPNLHFDNRIFWGKGAPAIPEEEGYPDIPHSLEELIPHVINAQSVLKECGIPSYFTGGGAIDLIGAQQFPDHQPRTHKDIDILIPRWALFQIAAPSVLPRAGFTDFKPWNASINDKKGFMSDNFINLRVFTNAQGIRLDMMGYQELGIDAFIPQMTWGGKVDMSRQDGTWFSTQPYNVTIADANVTVIHPLELEKMLRSLNMIKQGESNKQFDLQTLRRINTQ